MSTNKDWNGNGNSIFKTLGASNHTEKERETDDFYATEYVLHALRLLPTDGLLCLFLKTTFAEGKERYQRIFGVTPPALVLQCSERVLCAKNADFDGMIAGGGSAVSYAWWVWRKGWSGQTTLDWINHPSAQQAVQLELFM